MSNHQIIVIDDYFGQAGTGFVDGVMGSLLRVKREAYRAQVGALVLPVSAEDHYCLHVAIMERGTMRPVLVFKIVPYSRAAQHAQPFPFLEMAKTLYGEADYAALQRDVRKRLDRGVDVSYSGGWAIMPGTRRDQAHSRELKDMYTGLHFLAHQELGLASMYGFGAIEQGTYDFAVREWGSRSPVDADICIPFYNNNRCRAVALDMQHASKHKLAMAEKYRALWEHRSHFKAVSSVLPPRGQPLKVRPAAGGEGAARTG